MHRHSCVWILTVQLFIGLAPWPTYAQQPAIEATSEATSESVEAAEARRDYEVRIVGNQVLLDPVILWIMELPEQGPPTEQTAEDAQQRLERFFERTGYDLARVKAFVQRDVLWVFVDEGVLEEISVVGASTTRTFNLRLELELPEKVYNRIHVARQIERLERENDDARLEAELVEVRQDQPPIDYLQRFIAGADNPREEAAELWLEQSERHSLVVTVYTEEWGSGLDYGVSFLSPYGLRVSASYERTDLIFDADRYSISAEVGGLSDTLLTSADFEFFYAFPELFGESLRPTVDLDGLLDSFDRDTLGLENYRYFDASAVVSLAYEPFWDLVIAPGAGYGYDNVFGFSRTEQTPAYIDNQQREFFVGEIGLEWLISRVGLRRDKLHLLEAVLETRTVDQGLWLRFEGDYQKAWEFGYDDLFVRSNFFSFQGAGIEWFDEDPITSQVMRAVAGDEEFARHLLAVGTEYRLALHRNIVQAGLSASVAAAGLRERQTRETFAEFFAAGGPGLHIELLDNFQLNLFYHWGIQADGEIDGRFSLKFWKIY
jgi:hypothetical protein